MFDGKTKKSDERTKRNSATPVGIEILRQQDSSARAIELAQIEHLVDSELEELLYPQQQTAESSTYQPDS